MSFDGRILGTPPGQSCLRIEDDSDPVVITNAPSQERLEEQVAELGPMGAALLEAGPVTARVGSCFSSATTAIGWIFLVFGVVFIGAMAAAVFVFNQPFNFNGKPAGKDVAALFLGGFFAVWVTFCLVWIYFSRTAFRSSDYVDAQWRLVLSPDDWACYRIHTNQVIGRCSPDEIDRLSRATTGRVVAHLLDGKTVHLTGPLPSLDSGWLHEALTRFLGRAVEDIESVHPYIPDRGKHAVPGETLAWRLNRTDSPWGAVLTAAVVCVFWNGIVGVFLGFAFWGEPKINWWVAAFMIPFVLIGLLLICLVVACIYQAIVQSRIGDTAVELEALPLIAGQQFQAIVVQKGPLQLRRLSVRMVCDEEAEYRQGTTTSTDTKRVRDLQVYEQFDLIVEREPLAEAFDLRVPADVMHSFEGLHNSIKWKLIVRGEPESWPAYEREFPIVIQPPVPPEAT